MVLDKKELIAVGAKEPRLCRRPRTVADDPCLRSSKMRGAKPYQI